MWCHSMATFHRSITTKAITIKQSNDFIAGHLFRKIRRKLKQGSLKVPNDIFRLAPFANNGDAAFYFLSQFHIDLGI